MPSERGKGGCSPAFPLRKRDGGREKKPSPSEKILDQVVALLGGKKEKALAYSEEKGGLRLHP